MARRKKDQGDEPKVKITKASLKKSLRIFKFLYPFRIKFGVGLVFLLASSLTSMVFPALMGKLVQASGTSPVPDAGFMDLTNINNVALLLFGVFILQAIFSYFRILLFADVTENMLASLRQHTYAHLIRLPMHFFASKRVGELNSRISSDVAILQETFTTTLAEFFRQILTIIVGISFLAFYSIKLTLVMLATLPVIVIVAVIFGKFIKKLSKETQGKIAESNVIVEETLTAIQSVKAFVNEAFESIRYQKSTNTIKGFALRAAKWRAAFASFIIVCMFGAIVIVIWYGVRLKAAGEIDIAQLFSFVIYSVFVGASFGGMAELFAQIQKAIGATENLMEILDEEKEPIPEIASTNGIQLSGKVVFKNVHFEYASRPDVKVLNNINFDVEQGQQIAIVGSSGAGKSTLSSLLLRFYPISSGEILFDNLSSKDIPLNDLRNNMAIVPQEVLLFGGTIKENIAYGMPGASDKAIFEAAKNANAHDFISNFPEGYETLVGERGIQLSGGQRQRIAIARAVLKNPRILILDEATSSLDSESERLVQDALEKLMQNRTSFVIAHRLSTIKKANKILVLDKGELKEMGTHQELLALENGFYKKLSNLQIQNTAETEVEQIA